jgi:hypothetical protein
MCVQGELIEAIVLGDVGGDVDGALVAKLAAELDVVKGESVVRGFSPAIDVVSFIIPVYTMELLVDITLTKLGECRDRTP